MSERGVSRYATRRATTGRRVMAALLGSVALAGGPVLAGCAGTTSGGGAAAPTTAATGFTDFRATNPRALSREHRTGQLRYPMSPPVGGDHNPVWQNCDGDVYTAPVANEHAVHSLEHGAVWITYRPGLPAEQVAALAAKVRDRSYLFLSPYPGLDVPVSVQAWGYQLKVSSAADPRIDDFIRSYRMTATLEPGAPCSGGTTDTP